MIHSKSIRILKTLSKKELKQFGNFVCSPFFNKNRNLIKLFDVLKKYHRIVNRTQQILRTPNGGVIFVNQIGIEIPKSFILFQNYSNPFNPLTRIKFDITQDVRRQTKDVKLIIFDILGKEVATLVNEKLSAGSYKVEFDGNNFFKRIYFYRLETESFIQTKGMVLLKIVLSIGYCVLSIRYLILVIEVRIDNILSYTTN